MTPTPESVLSGAITMCVGSVALSYILMLLGVNLSRIIRATFSHFWGS